MNTYASSSLRLALASTVLGAIFWFWAMPAWCNDSSTCGFPVSIKNVSSLLSHYTGGPQPDAEKLEALARNLRAVDQKQLFALLYPMGLIDQWGQIERLLAIGEQVVRSGQYGDPSGLAGLLSSISQLDQMLCSAHSSDVKGDQVTGSSGGFGNRENRRGLFWWLRPETAAQKASFAFGSAAIAIVLLYVLDVLYRRLYSLIYNRQACQIPATFEADLDVIDGYVVALGRSNCRFKPVNRGAFVRLAALSAQRESAIFFGRERFAVRFESLGSGSGSYVFTPKLSLSVQRSLLTKSLISPTPIGQMFTLRKRSGDTEQSDTT